MSEHYAIEGSFSENRILATSLAQYTSKVIGHAAETTEFVADAYASNRMATLRESFAQRSPLSKILVDVTIYDYAGGCVWTIRRDCGALNQYSRKHDDDRRLFLSSTELNTYLSRTFYSNSLKRPLFYFSKAVRTERGGLKAFVRVLIDPLELSKDFYSLLKYADSRISISGTDGYTRLRVYADGSWGSDQLITGYPINSSVSQALSGAQLVDKGMDGKPLAVGWRKLEVYPLYVTVSSTLDDVLHEHRRLRVFLLAGLVIFGSLLGFLYLSLMRIFVLSDARIRHADEKLAALREVNDLKSDIVNVVAHELRSPLSSIMGFAELIAVTTKEEETRDYANTALQGANKLAEIVNNMLDLARLNDGRIETKIEEIELAKLLEGFRKLFSQSAGRKDLELVAEIESGVKFRCDSGGLGRVISNLLQNSIKFTRQGRVTLRGKRSAGGILVEVEDTGIGIPADDLPDIFGRFSNVDKSRHPEGKGAGLGLALVKETVEAMGGRISIESTVDKGTCVSVWIPEVPPAAEGA